MHWLYPLFLAGAIGAVLPFVLHLLRGHASRASPLPSVRFLKQEAASTRFHRFQRWFVLLCRAAVFVLLAAAFARPYRTEYLSASRATVVVVDNSFSMQVAGRGERARRTALETLGPSRPGEAIGILGMNPQPAWIVPLTSDAATARAALESLQPGWEATRIEPAVRLAADVLAANPAEERRLLVLTDHQRMGWVGADFSRALPSGIDVIFSASEPAPAGQAYVGRASVLRQPDGALAVEASVAAAPGTSQARTVRVYVDEQERPAVELPVSLRGGEQRDVRCTLPMPDVRWVRVSLDPDALPADDVAYAVAPLRRERGYRVLMDAGRNGEFDYVGAALGAMARLNPKLEAVPLPVEDAWPLNAAVVLRSATTLNGEPGAKLLAFLEAGGSALVFAGPEVAASPWWRQRDIGITSAVADSSITLSEWTAEHPLLVPLAKRGLRGLVGWQFRRVQSLAPAAVQPIGFWSTGQIAVGEARVGRGRLLICGFPADRSDGDWPTESAFLPFLHRALVYLLEPNAGVGEHVARYRVGESIPLPPGVGTWRVLAGPVGAPRTREVEGNVAPDAPGVYAFEQSVGTQLYAVNLAIEESDLSPWSPGEPWRGLATIRENESPFHGAVRGAMAAADAEQRNGLWGWFLLAAVCLLVVELTAANRTTR